MQTYAALISGYCETGNLAAASGLLDVMTANGLDPGFSTYTALVAGKEAHALLLWWTMAPKYCYYIMYTIR